MYPQGSLRIEFLTLERNVIARLRDTRGNPLAGETVKLSNNDFAGGAYRCHLITCLNPL